MKCICLLSFYVFCVSGLRSPFIGSPIPFVISARPKGHTREPCVKPRDPLLGPASQTDAYKVHDAAGSLTCVYLCFWVCPFFFLPCTKGMQKNPTPL